MNSGFTATPDDVVAADEAAEDDGGEVEDVGGEVGGGPLVPDCEMRSAWREWMKAIKDKREVRLLCD
jgi:hypothetical protein